MGTLYYTGLAPNVAQVASSTWGTYDVATTRKITIGTKVVSAVDSGGTLANALTALATALNASTDPYFTPITWSSDATHIIGTADTAGVPFVFAGSVTGGTGTCSVPFSITTANSSAPDWSVATNWNTGAVPVNGDDVVIDGTYTGNICWGFAQSAVTLNSLIIRKTYTGNFGLNSAVFTTSADGATTVSTAIEYRQVPLAISSTNPIKLGENASLVGTASGSGRILLDVGSVASQTIEVLGTKSSATDSGKCAVRILANAATITLLVRSAPGGVGIAMDKAGETSTLGTVYVSDTSTASKVIAGTGVTWTTWEQTGGQNVLQSAGTTLNAKGGTLATEGSGAITTANVYSGATVTSNSTGTITTLNLYGGTTDFTKSSKARTVTNRNWQKDSNATLKADSSIVTFTNTTDPATSYSMTAG